MPMKENTERFSDRVDNYAKYRPGYSEKILGFLNEYNFSARSIIADVGSGTGKLAELFLKNGNKTYAVEPNTDMRNMSDSLLTKYDNYVSINGTAEKTTLGNASVDFIVVGQAFHWFDAKKTLNEFRRVLKNNGVLVLIWNNRKLNTEFLIEYDSILKKFSKEYGESSHRNISDEVIEKYFSADFKKNTIDNHQKFNFIELMGRFSSGSYTPKEGTDEYQNSYNALKKIFHKYKKSGKIIFNYDTKLFTGRIHPKT